ncbi:MAG: glycosyltransferase [Candidatus Eisenbacteria bacterium]
MSAASVLLVTEQVDVGGKRSHVEILKAGLEVIGWNAPLVDWASLSWPERAIAAAPYRMLHALSPGAGYPWLLPVATSFLARAIRRRLAAPDAPGLVHVQEVLTYRAARAAARGRPVVLTIHGPLGPELSMVSGLPLDHPAVERLRRVEREAYLGADLVISVDGPHAAYVRSFGRAGAIPVIPNFVDTRRYHPGVAAGPLPPAVEGWIAGRPVVLVPRRLVPKNGIATAVRMARVMMDRGVPAAIVLAGDGPQRRELEALARDLGVAPALTFLGEVRQAAIPGWLIRAAVVLVPSSPVQGVEEATSIAALEAQACGRPVVASAIGGLVEIIEDGSTGRLVPPDAPEQLADATCGLLADPAQAAAIGGAAARFVAAEHSHVHGARLYAAAYESVLARAPATYARVARLAGA